MLCTWEFSYRLFWGYVMLSEDGRQARRAELMNKHKRKGGFSPQNDGRLRALYDRCYINPALDLFLFKPKRKSK